MRAVGLVVEPGLRQKDREQSEQDCKADHDDGTGTHVRPLLTPRNLFCLVRGESIGPPVVWNW